MGMWFWGKEMSDAGVAVIEKVMKDFPERRIRILSNAPQIGSNRKINNLALLTREANYEILLQTDGDVRIGPNYIRELVATFVDPTVSVGSSFYGATAENSFCAQLQAVGAAVEFITGAIVVVRK